MWVAVLLAFALIPGLVVTAAPAGAHAVLERSTPAQGAVLPAVPSEVTLGFDEPVTLLPTSIQVFAPDGRRVGQGTAEHPSGDPRSARIGIASSQQGTYLVSWRVVSADSHPVAGAFTFSVGKASKTVAAPALHASRALSWSLGGARWLGYAGSALLLGILVVLAWCRPARRAVIVERLLWSGVVLLALGAVLEMLLKGPDDASLGFSAVGRTDLLREVWQTTYGMAVVTRFLLACVGAVLVVRRRRWGISVWALLVGVTFAVAGHGAAGSLRTLAVISGTAHAIAASIWLGGLVVIAVVIGQGEQEALPVVRRFSRLALASVCVLVVTGAFQSWRGVGWSWGALAETTYGRLLLFKLLLVANVVLLASFSRAWVSSRTDGARQGPARQQTDLRRTVLGEMFGVIAVLALTSGLTATQPARTAYHPTTRTTLVIEGDTVQVGAVPDGDRQVELHLYVVDQHGRPTDPPEVNATVSHGNVGPLPVHLNAVGSGYRVGVIDVPVAGTWKFALTVRTTEIDESTRTVDVPIR